MLTTGLLRHCDTWMNEQFNVSHIYKINKTAKKHGLKYNF